MAIPTASPMIIALAGNPNVGKSTLFNALTGGRQHVGNWPGKTVEKKEGWMTLDGQDIMIVDLPGTYSLAAYSAEEIIARDYLLRDHTRTVIAVVDAANLERNLYLVSQLMELGASLILALNMSDTAQSRGLQINTQTLSAALGGIPVIEMVGNHGMGLDNLRAAILQCNASTQQPLQLTYDAALEQEISALQTLIERETGLLDQYPPRWLAIKLLENDPYIYDGLADYAALLTSAQTAIERVTAALGDDPETLLTDQRYQFIGQTVSRAVTRSAQNRETMSDSLDRIITHRLWGLPIFLGMMWLVFQITTTLSAPLIDWTDVNIIGTLSRLAQALMDALGLGDSWLTGLVVDGIIAGVGGVLVFVPLLMLLYLTIGILEDSGYMARAAFVMDRAMRVIGLHGKSFLPLLIGFGCTVPAVYATRTLENERDRKLTAFIATFMSCGARLPVYVLFAGVFFGAYSGNVIFGLYLLGIAIALLTGLAFKRLVYRGMEPQPFVMELPPYRMPHLKTVVSQMWDRTYGFVRKATTLILACSIVVWLLMALPANLDLGKFAAVDAEASVFGSLSQTLSPVFAPAGFGEWQATGALITGFVAKEVVVGTMSQVYSVEADDNDGLGLALTKAFTPLSAVAFMVFVLLYTPCMTTIAAMRHEFGGRWTLYQMGYATAIAWVAAVVVYQGGLLLGLG